MEHQGSISTTTQHSTLRAHNRKTRKSSYSYSCHCFSLCVPSHGLCFCLLTCFSLCSCSRDCGFFMFEYLAHWVGRKVPVVTLEYVTALRKVLTFNWVTNTDFNKQAGEREF